jgi:hypothetical protein
LRGTGGDGGGDGTNVPKSAIAGVKYPGGKGGYVSVYPGGEGGEYVSTKSATAEPGGAPAAVEEPGMIERGGGTATPNPIVGGVLP